MNDTFTETLNTVNGTITFSQTAGNFSINITPVDYFSKKIGEHNASVDLTAKVTQSILRINASQVGTAVVINSFNVTVPLQTNATNNGTAILLLKAGTYTIVGESDGFVDSSKSITISAKQTLVEVLEFGTSNFTVFAQDIFSNITINDFNVTVIGTTIDFENTISTNIGRTSFSLIDGTYTVNITASDYTTQSTSITISEAIQNHTFQLFIQNSIFMRFLRENDDLLITDQTMSVDVENEDNTFQGTFTTSNGTLFLPGLPPSTYILEPFSTEFVNKRKYFVTISGGGHIDIDFRLLNATDGKVVTFRILDFNTDAPISGAVLTATKTVNLSDLTVDQDTTDDTGISQLFLKETQRYTLLITHPSYITRIVSLTPTTDDTITIKLLTGVTFEFTTIFSRFNYLILPTESIITPGNRSFNLTVTCTVDFSGCLDFFGFTFNSSLIDNITASPGGGTASLAFFVDNVTTDLTFSYFIKVNDFDIFKFNFTYIQRPEIETGNQSFVKLLETYDGLFPDWFKPFIAVLCAILAMVVLKRFTEIPGTGLAVVGLIVEIFFAIFNWIPRLIMFVIALVVFIGWLLTDRGDL